MFDRKSPVNQGNGLVLLAGRQMRIAERHGHALVAQEVPDHGEIGPIHDQLTGKGMPEVMKAKIVDIGPLESGQ